MQPAIRFVRRSVRAAVVHVVFVAIQLSLARAANGESSSRPAARRFGQAADCDDSSGATINQQNDACTCTSSHILKPKAGESSWVYSSKGICCNMICKFHGDNTACLAARMTKGDDRKIGAACGTTNVSCRWRFPGLQWWVSNCILQRLKTLKSANRVHVWRHIPEFFELFIVG